jgi:hypothetical protein
MPLSPDDIHLEPEQKKLIADLAEAEQKPWPKVLQDALDSYRLGKQVPATPGEKPRRRAGNGKGKVWMAPDFDEPLEEFKDYL